MPIGLVGRIGGTSSTKLPKTNATVFVPKPSSGAFSNYVPATSMVSKSSPAKVVLQSYAPTVAKLPATSYAATTPSYSGGSSGGGGSYSSGGGSSRSYSSGGSSGGGGSYSGGGGGGTATGNPVGSATEPLSGFAKRHYLPGGIQDVLNNPGVIARDVLAENNMETDALGNLYAQQGQYFVSQILPLLYGQDKIGAVPTANNMVNKAAEYLQGLSVQGGAVVDPMKLMRVVMEEASKGSASANTILSSLFAGQTPDAQAKSFRDITGNLANWAPSPMMATAMRNWSSRQGDEYLRRALSVNNTYKEPIGKFMSDQDIFPE